MTYHTCDFEAPLRKFHRPDRLRQIYLRSLQARTAKEKALLGRSQSDDKKTQATGSTSPRTDQS